MRLTVSDTGHGIAPDDLPLVTWRFYRTVESRSRGVSGSGLGLAIARELVELHGGVLEIESTLGAGTTVAFTLPTQAPEPGGTGAPAEPTTRSPTEPRRLPEAPRDHPAPGQQHEAAASLGSR